MTNSSQIVTAAVQSIQTYDELENEHKEDVLAWVRSGEPIFRVAKPDKPFKHLVSFFVLLDEARESILLIDHIKSKSWLPTGGHVDIDEDPRQTVIREAKEELRIKANFNTPFGDSPFFITLDTTNGYGNHTDVSLWYIIKGDVDKKLRFDPGEMNSCKWYTFNEVLAMSTSQLNPNTHRFIEKMKRYLANYAEVA